ncbi:MAG TPA: hypothetical protein VJR46_04230 [Candidatus Dormibacteraeota bacterium]|nr:hypothetical protein [Candidatus Dormibacteraeota bacterium]
MQPYWLHAYLLVYTPLGLFADSKVTAVWQQDVLGGLTFAVLFLAALKTPKEQRVQVWTCVAVATCFEIFGSLVWGVYRYRLHNLPLFVPPGHGIVYLFGLLAAQTPVVRRHGRRVAHAVLAAAATWATLGLTVLPAVTGRFDLQGVLCLPVFAYFLLRSPRWPLFAAIFVIVGELEICGTSFGNWTWMAVAPWTHIPSGNPPSVIAGGYCVIDGTVLMVTRLAARGPREITRNALISRGLYRLGLNTIVARMTSTMIPRPGPNLALNPASRAYSGEEA